MVETTFEDYETGELYNDTYEEIVITPNIIWFDSDSETWTKTGEMTIKR